MTVGLARVVDEPGEVSAPTLPDLIRLVVSHLALHDIGVGETLCDQADVFTYCDASRKRGARYQSIVASFFRLENLDRRIFLRIDSEQFCKAHTFILSFNHRLTLRAQLAEKVGSLFQAPGILVPPFLFVNLRLCDVPEREVGVPLTICERQGKRVFSLADNPGMWMPSPM